MTYLLSILFDAFIRSLVEQLGISGYFKDELLSSESDEFLAIFEKIVKKRRK